MTGARFACSWSGGKDSCLAMHLMATAGAAPAALLTVFDDAGERSRSHGLAPSILQAQAKSLDLPLHTARASWQDYEREFIAALQRLAADGIRDIVFGDIDLDEHRAWEERVCAAAGVNAHLPLWRAKRREVLDELWRSGHRCHVVAVDAQKLGRDVLGQELTPELADRLESLGVDACGENGEFHTVVCDGPRFRYPLRLRFGEIVEHGGYLAIDCACEP